MAFMEKKTKGDKIKIEDAYVLYKEEAGEEIENVERKKNFLQKQKEKRKEQADIKRKVKQEQAYSNTEKKLEKMRLECEAIQKKQKDNPNVLLSKAERKKLLSFVEAERKAKLKKQNDEKRNLKRKVKRMLNRRRAISNVPKSVQESIPYIADYEEGLFEIEEGLYSKTFELQDINYQVAKEEEQIAIFCKYGEFLNYFSSDMCVNISIINRKVQHEAQSKDITLELKGDELDEHRKEYNKILLRNLASGKNDVIQKKYITVTIKANNPFEAILKFHKVQNEVSSNIKRIGSNAKVLSTDDRLALMHDILRAGHEGEFHIDYDFIKKQGISSKDYIAPSSLFFDRDYFMIDNRYYRVMFLNNLPASISDDFMAKITDTDFPTITNIMVQPVEQENGLKIVNKRVAGMETEKIEQQKAAMRSGYDPNTISHNLEQSIYEGQVLQDDMINKNQKMYLTALTVMVGADSLEELTQNCETLESKARQFTCRLQTLNYQQEEGFVQSLPLGHDALYLNRTLTTESLSIFIPFTSNELFEPNGFYYGSNQISKNLVMFDRKNLNVPHGFVLGSSGSGKSFAVKSKEMLKIILDEDSDMIIIDPDNEYMGFISAFASCAEIVNISANSKSFINPLDLSLNYSDGDADPLTLKSNYILSLVESMMSIGENRETIITPPQRTLVDRALKRTYRNYIEHNYDEEYQPTLLDFQAELDEEKKRSEDGRVVAEAVEFYTKGSMSVFAHKTNVDLKKRLIVFNTRDLGGQLKQIGLMIVLDFIWNKMVQNKDENKITHLYIDEVHTLFTNEFSASFLKNLFKRGRKYGLIITAITQDVTDLLDNADARTMISNSDYILMLNQANENVKVLAEMLHLSDSQKSFVTMSDAGSGLLFAGNVIVPFQDQFPEDSYLYKLMSTKFGEDKKNKITKEDELILRKHFNFLSIMENVGSSSHGEDNEQNTISVKKDEEILNETSSNRNSMKTEVLKESDSNMNGMEQEKRHPQSEIVHENNTLINENDVADSSSSLNVDEATLSQSNAVEEVDFDSTTGMAESIIASGNTSLPECIEKDEDDLLLEELMAEMDKEDIPSKEEVVKKDEVYTNDIDKQLDALLVNFDMSGMTKEEKILLQEKLMSRLSS